MVLNRNEEVRSRILNSATVTKHAGQSVLSFRAMGSICRVLSQTREHLAEFHRDTMEWVARFEEKYSRFLPDSLISRINARAGTGDWTELDGETDTLFRLCDEAHFITRGTFDPTALPLIQLWDWKRHRTELPTGAQIKAAMEKVGWRRFQRRSDQVRLPDAGMCIDLGGMGKEYAVDRVVAMARSRGWNDILVDFGQDLFAAGLPGDGRQAWHIGLEDPRNPDRCHKSLALRDHAVATSGDYRRRFQFQGKHYGHILDVRTGVPVDNGVLSVTVIAGRCTLAGLLSTSAFVLGPRDGLKLLESFPMTAGCITCADRTLQTREFQRYVAQ